MEDKRKICDLLLPVLQATEKFKQLEDLEYDEENDKVIATYASGKTRHIYVRLLTGAGMIKHIIHCF